MQAAASLGATRIVAVLAVPLAQPPDRRDFTRMSGAGIFLRSVGAVAFADRQLANLKIPRCRRGPRCDALVTARTQAWHLEEAIWAAGRPRPGDLVVLGRLERAVRDALDERKGLGIPNPPEAERWWSGYEEHRGASPVGLPEDPSAGVGRTDEPGARAGPG